MIQLLSLIDVLNAPARVFYLRFFCLFTGFYSRSLFIYATDIKFAGIPVAVLFSLFTILTGATSHVCSSGVRRSHAGGAGILSGLRPPLMHVRYALRIDG